MRSVMLSDREFNYSESGESSDEFSDDDSGDGSNDLGDSDYSVSSDDQLEIVEKSSSNNIMKTSSPKSDFALDSFIRDTEWDTKEWSIFDVHDSLNTLIAEIKSVPESEEKGEEEKQKYKNMKDNKLKDNVSLPQDNNKNSKNIRKLSIAIKMVVHLVKEHPAGKDYLEGSALRLVEKGISVPSKLQKNNLNITKLITCLVPVLVEKFSKLNLIQKILTCISERYTLAGSILQKKFRMRVFERKMAKSLPLNIRIRKRYLMILDLGLVRETYRKLMRDDRKGLLPFETIVLYLKMLDTLTDVKISGRVWAQKNTAAIRRRYVVVSVSVC